MMSVAIERLHESLPGSTIKVLTDEPHRLNEFCPAATPFSSLGRTLWLREDFLPRKLAAVLPPQFAHSIRWRAPRVVTTCWRWKMRNDRRWLDALNAFTNSLDEARLVVVTGMGGIADAFPEYAGDLLEVLNLALSTRARSRHDGTGHRTASKSRAARSRCLCAPKGGLDCAA